MKYKGYLTDSPSMRVSKQIETNLAITNPGIKWLEQTVSIILKKNKSYDRYS